MNLLLDTHIALWAIDGSARLPKKARDFIQAEANHVWVSVVSVWEIAIKRTARPRTMPYSAEDARDMFLEAGYRVLPVTADHACAVEKMPPLHSDPFDRLLVAQALREPLRLITHDKQVAAYSDTIILV